MNGRDFSSNSWRSGRPTLTDMGSVLGALLQESLGILVWIAASTCELIWRVEASPSRSLQTLRHCVESEEI